MDDAMLYNKTPKAWGALAQPEKLGRLAHTLVLMANGRRSLRELSLLTGTNIATVAHRLCAEGYLEAQQAPPAPAHDWI
jgi:hypothetical protein